MKLATFSTRTLTALTTVVTGGRSRWEPLGFYRSGEEIELFFGDLDIDIRVSDRSRISAVRRLLVQLNSKPGGLETITRVLEAVGDPESEFNSRGFDYSIVDYLNDYLRVDGFELRKIDRRFRLVSIATNARAASDLQDIVSKFNLDSVRRDFDRALEQADRDPEDAITAACSTIESVCKCLLDEMGHPYPRKQDVSGLVKEVQKHLELSPGQPDLQADVKQILGGLSAVTGGIGALRTHAGDAHGRGKKALAVDARLARLAIHAASSVALFFIETWQKQKRS